MHGAVEVSGLRELRRALRDIQDVDGLNEMRRAFRSAAVIVADEAKLRANTFSFRAADTIRAGTSSTAAYVKGGKDALPWYGWADFGSRNPRSGQPRSVGPWANSGRGPTDGRFIYPAIAATKDEVVDVVEDALASAARRLGFDTDAT